MSSKDSKQKNCNALISWAAGLEIGSGSVLEHRLPEALASQTQNGLATIARSGDGRTFVLVKRTVGYKDNFEGVLALDQPLQAGELIVRTGQSTYITLAGLGVFEELFVSRQLSATCYEVYFDLN